MEHTATQEEHNKAAIKEIVKITVYLSVLTVVELILGFWMMGMPLESGLRLAVKGTIVILMMAKAFYIVAYFMHLKHEIKSPRQMLYTAPRFPGGSQEFVLLRR